MDIFKKKKQKQVTVNSFEWVESADGKNYFLVNYTDGEYEKKFRDYINLPYPESVRWAKPENLVVETQKSLQNLVNHVGARYQNFLQAFYEKNVIESAYQDCILKAFPYILDTDDLEKVMANEGWDTAFRDQLRNAIGCFLSGIGMATCSAKLYLHISWDGKYFNPTDPNKLTVVKRLTKENVNGKNVWTTHAWDYKGPQQMFFSPDGYNAQYPLQSMEHNRDIVGYLFDTIKDGSAANNNEMYLGKCTPYTMKVVTRLQIKKKEGTPVEAEVDADVPQEVDVDNEW